MSIRFVELGIVVVMTAGEVNNIPHVIAELRRGRVPGCELGDHLANDIVLKLAIENAARITENMKHHLLRSAQVLGDLGKIIRKRVMIRRQAQWPGKRLKTCVSISDGVQRADAGVGLGILGNGVGADSPGSQSNLDKGLLLRDNL